jgi:hypothetical protein
LVRPVDLTYAWFAVLLRIPFFSFSIWNQMTGCNSNHYSAMAPKSRAIPIEEWERHKDAIKGLFAQKNLAEVVEEMKRRYDFDAT